RVSSSSVWRSKSDTERLAMERNVSMCSLTKTSVLGVPFASGRFQGLKDRMPAKPSLSKGGMWPSTALKSSAEEMVVTLGVGGGVQTSPSKLRRLIQNGTADAAWERASSTAATVDAEKYMTITCLVYGGCTNTLNEWTRLSSSSRAWAS